MIAESKNRNPYPGPRPFGREESEIFFGREREARELLSLITAHRTVLLYAQSGAGKTSLLNAGVIPSLTEEGFDVLPVARIRGFEPQGIDLGEILNIYAFNTLVGWATDIVQPISLVSTTIGTFLKEREHLSDEQGLPLPRVAIFDQFEELFTSYPGRWEEREDLFRQVAEALDADPLLRILFVIREDYLASLDSYVDLLPERLRTRYRLRRLRAEAACQAVEGPLKDTEYSFAEGVASSLVQQLLNIRVTGTTGEIMEITGEYVEPVQLQVVCQSLWINLPREVTVITSDHLQEFGDVQEALRNFYERSIEKAKLQTGVSESDLRRWFNDKLITPAGTRGTVFQGKEQTEGIANSAVGVLEAQHIVRAEMRAGARWYELTHDRLIEPISKSNEKFERMEEQRRAEAQSRARIARCLRRIAAALVVICIVTLPPIMIYLSVFPHSLTVSFVGGSVTKNPDKARYSDGETVILEAVPNEGYVFANWSGDLSDSNNPVVLIMDSKKLVQANFLLTYSLTVNVINGSVMKDPNQEYYDVNDTVTLTAMPNNEKFTFRGWSGDLPESSDPNNTTLKLVMNGEKSVTASFEAPDNIQQVTLTARFDWYDTWDSRDKWITQGLDVDTNKVVTSPGWQRSPMKFGKPIELTSWCTQASQGQWRLHFNVPFVQLSSVPYDYFSEYTQQKIKKMLSDGDVVKIPVQNPGDYSYNVKDIFFFKTTEESYAKLHVLDRTVRGESGYSRRGILKIRYVVYNGN